MLSAEDPAEPGATTSMSEIDSAAALRTVYDAPSEVVLRKDIGRIDGHARAFIGRSPFVVVATADADGWPDASPRGDAPGFVGVDGERTLLLPDRPGNNRLDTLSNLLVNPRIGLIFMIPGRQDTLRVNGSARVLHDPLLRARFAFNNKPARSVVEVTVREAYFHCGKAMIRSGLWQPERWPSLEGLATLGEAIADQTGAKGADVEQRIAESYRDRLY